MDQSIFLETDSSLRKDGNIVMYAVFTYIDLHGTGSLRLFTNCKEALDRFIELCPLVHYIALMLEVHFSDGSLTRKVYIPKFLDDELNMVLEEKTDLLEKDLR